MILQFAPTEEEVPPWVSKLQTLCLQIRAKIICKFKILQKFIVQIKIGIYTWLLVVLSLSYCLLPTGFHKTA
ncbi:hypothetical protein CS542_08310 [Pedobacter sp. IW39]|nr:hypothetical protein CS542_08310 [Pedobacter sp. IW39]